MRTVTAVVTAALVACTPTPEPGADAGPAVLLPDLACPGDEGCAEDGDEGLLAGAAKVVVTPQGFEIARATWLDSTGGGCAPEAPLQGADPALRRCGVLKDTRLDDCGTDGLCPGEEGWIGPDVDGSEGDGSLHDWFYDCGRDRLCPDGAAEEGARADNGFDDDGDGAVDEGAYPGPDDDGSEGDGIFQGLWIAGYDNSRPALGVKDDLWARVVVLQQGETTIAVVVVDAIGLFYDVQQAIRDRVQAARPGAVDLLLLQASHTHEAPDTMGQWGVNDPFAGLQLGHGRDDLHMELIQSGAVSAVLQALDALVPVTVHVGAVATGAEGFLRDTRNPRIFNDVLTAIDLVDVDGASVATIVNWGNHPETLASRNNFVSSDYLHGFREAIERGLPATASAPARAGKAGVAIYAQGAVGGLMVPNGFPITARDGTVFPDDVKSFARTDAYGETIAEQAFRALNDAEPLEAPRLRFSTVSYAAPVKNQAFHVGIFNGWFDRRVEDFDDALVIGEGNWPSLRTAVALVFLGPIGMVTAPGELFPETFVGFDPAYSLGQPRIDDDNALPPDLDAAPSEPALQELLGVAYPLALGLCQDEIGYLVPPYDFVVDEVAPYISDAPGDHYEETNSIGPEAVPLMLLHLQRLFAFEAGRAE